MESDTCCLLLNCFRVIHSETSTFFTFTDGRREGLKKHLLFKTINLLSLLTAQGMRGMRIFRLGMFYILKVIGQKK